ncbi:2,3-dihydro-2,3-dihydroxybenzoate dehydrogenase [Streptomyces sp. TRM49041]|uniref:2,3-dihydro-2,3-dihydroxybenzoate dehydrogenase n=1 Tax=Streptomyces sp. TRM49041 TaxID=2603216 RepID=UPI0011EF3D06|nr:2,3-dihydro-2,3-dihydroxybenzoate dehydrogenase [Streptomyces sp. TRM49041]
MQGKTALVTGAAGGIGDAIVQALAERGVRVAAVDRDADRLRDRAKAAVEQDLRVYAFPADITSSAEVDSLVDDVEALVGPVDYLVNGAGVLRLAEARSLTDDEWATTFAVNTTGVFFVSRAVVNRMVTRGHGAIVTVASNAAGTARTEMSAYAASKAAATMFTKCLGLEVAKYGIRANIVAPGSTYTPMLTSMWKDEQGANASLDGVPEAYRVGIPLRKLAQPGDVADAVVFLLSDRASHITMHDLTVDGGAALGV